MMLVLINHRELTTESKSSKLSIIRFCTIESARGAVRYAPLSSTYLTGFFKQNLVVLAESNAEDDGGDVLEAVYPFLPLASLTTHIKHAATSLVA